LGAIEPGHIEIEKKKRGLLAMHQFQRLGAVIRFITVVTRGGKCSHEHLPARGIIIHYQNSIVGFLVHSSLDSEAAGRATVSISIFAKAFACRSGDDLAIGNESESR